ncbi:MAG: efflux RND transporter periplasmic adaptor subunit [Pseudomonadales bacterium]
MRATYITAIAIALAIGAWLLSGQLGRDGGDFEHATLAEQKSQRSALGQDRQPSRVRARIINASRQFRYVVVRGKTANKRTVVVRTELSGTIVARPVERGTAVMTGDLLCKISIEDRQVGVMESREALNQARIEYQGSLKLKAKGFQSDTAIAQAKAKLAAAEAQLQRSNLDVARTNVIAPFDGVVEDIHQEVGDYVTPGNGCSTIVDLDPMLLVGRVSEREVLHVQVGQIATGTLSDGSEVSGAISFIGQQSDPATRTYPIEVRIPNPDHTLRSGITTEIKIPVTEVMAQKVSPALFALDDLGNIGIRTVNESGRVEFHTVEIVEDDVDGVWVTGLPDIATLITVGQELVIPGEIVEIDYEPAPEMPAAIPPPAPAPQTAIHATAANEA